MRFTRALLESKDLSMWFSLPLCVWVSGLSPFSVETASEKRSPRTSYPPGWEVEFAGGGISKPPSGKKRLPTGLHTHTHTPTHPFFIHLSINA